MYWPTKLQAQEYRAFRRAMMCKRNIYLVQVDTLRKLPTHKTVYLPYAVGGLWAYARQSGAVEDTYALGEFIFIREPVGDVVSRMEAPFLVGFSCYVWSTEYSKALAQAVKRAFPQCLILFGGHNVPPGGAMLDELPYVDYLLHGEGEIPFQALLEELGKEKPGLAAVPGLSYRTGGGTATNRDVYAQSIEEFPSPYLTGLFDPILAAHPDIQFSTVWETNRGCPNRCAYCDWGEYKSQLRLFTMERLLAEAEWMGRHGIGYFYCADANFGILPRDEDLAQAIAAVKDRTGYPRMLDYNTTKTISERIFRITERLHRSGLDKIGLSLSMQSLSSAALRSIGRENQADEKIAHWIRRCRAAGFKTHTDLIIGLPGETLQSFCAGVGKLFELGQHEGVRYNPCHLLPNARMATPEYREKHMLRTRRHVVKFTMEALPETIPEYMDTIIETADMPYGDWLRANYFAFLAHGAHSYGLLRLIAMYLHTEKVISYADFYSALLDYCHAHPASLPGEALERTEQSFLGSLRGEQYEPLQIPGFSFGNMADEQYFFSRAVLEPERFYAGLEPFLRQFLFTPHLLPYQRQRFLTPGAV